MESRQNKNIMLLFMCIITVAMGQIVCPAALYND